MITQTGRHSIFSLRSLSQAGSATTFMVGFLVLVGWISDIPSLKSVLPGLTTMKANTALAFILAGVSLWVLQREQTSQRTRRIGQACAAVVALVGMLTLSEYVLDLDLGLDQLLFKDSLGAVRTSHLGRMSPVTALNFALVGCALLLLKTNRGILPGQYLAIGAAIPSLTALVGYAYGEESLYSVSGYTSMALHTAMTFLVLSFGIFYAHPARGLMGIVIGENTGSALVRRLLPFAILAPLVGGWLGIKGQDAGLYGTGFGMALFAVTLMLIFVAVIGWTAQSLSRSDEKRKRAEGAILEALETLDATRDGAFIFDPRTLRFSYVNEGAVQQVGYSREELLRMTPLDIKPEFDEPRFRAMIAPLVSGQQRLQAFTTVHRRKDSVDVPVEINLQCVGAGTAQARLIAIARDITERNRATEKIAQMAERLDLATSAAQIGVWDWNIPKNELVWDDRMFDLYGVKKEDFGGAYDAWLSGVHPEDRARCDEAVQQALRNEKPYDIEFRIQWPNGVVRNIKADGKIARDADGTPLRMTGTNYDITERKRTEEALRRAHDELEGRVQERTAEIVKKTRDLETLLYVISHDLREPLRSIENFSRLVHDRYAAHLDDKGRDFLRRIVRGVQRMDRLMTDILVLSRAQRMEHPAEEVEGETIVREALRQLEDKVKETGATVRVAKDLPRLQGNRTWATQGVYNLIANALKFRRIGDGEAPKVEIATYQPTVEDGPVVGIVVRDRGPGVAPEHAERIFELFQRAVGREVEGTGAGLAIVRQVAERHGGHAWVQPREGGGSEFILTFGATNRSEIKKAP